MEKLFETVLGMSGTASIVVLLVLLARLALRKAPRVFSYALWAVVVLRLLCPFTVESAFSLLPSAQVVSVAGRGESVAQVIRVQTGIAPVDRQVNDFFVDHPYQGLPARPEDAETVPAPPINEEGPAPDWRTVPATLWLAGTALLLGYSALSLLRLRRRLVGWVPLEGEKGVRLADHIPSPFVLGLFRPKIYLPSSLPEGERDYILLHERTHIRRCDHIFRALAWVALAVHWFNPLVWLAFHLAGKDMEMSCDEAVLRKMGRDVRADYSTSLLRLSQGGRLPAGPLAFGGGDPQSRIKNVLRYKKPALWVIVLALVGVTCAGVALATDQKQLFIDPQSVTSVTAIRATSHTTTPQNTGVYTEADRQKDLSTPANADALSEETGAELVRLLNSHRRTVYARGELEHLNGWEHYFYRIDCAGGDFYLMDYWYWNGFSFNPLHFGDDSYTTLVTYYDPQGVPGTTWQMEYNFDHAYKDWRSGITLPEKDSDWAGPASLGFTPVYTMYEQGRIRVTGEGLGRRAFLEWSPEGGLYFAGDPGGLCPSLAGESAEGGASWTDRDRTALEVTFNVNDERVSPGTVSGFRIHFTVDRSGAVTQKDFRSLEGETLELTDEEMSGMASILAALMQGAQDYYESDPPLTPTELLEPTVLGVSYALDEEGGVSITGLDCKSAVWSSQQLTASFDAPENALGYLELWYPWFLGEHFNEHYLGCTALYSPDDDPDLVWIVANDIEADKILCCTVNMSTGEVTNQRITSPGWENADYKLSGAEMVQAAQALAGLIQGASDFYENSRPVPEEGALPFNAPMQMVFSSGAGGWETLITLHPDGAFQGDYHDMDMGDSGPGYQSTEYVCKFHGRFGDIRQVTAASWSLTLEELVIDTGHPVGEEWIEPITTNEGYTYRLRYVSSGPSGFGNAAGGSHPGIWFMLYTPEAKGYAPGDELYGMREIDDYDSIMHEFWGWWPDKRTWTPDSTLGSWGLCNMETGYGFFHIPS